MVLAAALVALFGFAAAYYAALRHRNIHLWLGSYVRGVLARKPRSESAITDVYFCFVDHFEPYWNRGDATQARERLERWCSGYEPMAARHRDSDGRPPQHTYFYPSEEYDPELLDRLAGLCRSGLGDVEVHLHHDRDTAEGLRDNLLQFKRVLHERHGLLRKNAQTGDVEFGFIHGNWALDNSHPQGRWCGVNNELDVLRKSGCYADFTLPSAPSETQTRTINSIYFATDDPQRPKSHDTGRPAATGFWDDEALLIIQGPLTLNWKHRKWGILPRVENAEISSDNRPTLDRVRLWASQAIHVEGVPDSIFIKVHSHGVQEDNLVAFFEEGVLDDLYRCVTAVLRPEDGYRLHFVTARELYDHVRRLCLGDQGKEEVAP